MYGSIHDNAKHTAFSSRLIFILDDDEATKNEPRISAIEPVEHTCSMTTTVMMGCYRLRSRPSFASNRPWSFRLAD